MADNYEAKIILGADTKGADDTVKALDNVEKKASSTSKKTAGGFHQIQQAVGKAGSAVGTFNRILGGLGLAGIFASAIAAVDRFVGSVTKAKEEAIHLKEESEKAADAEKVKKLAEEYDKLTTSISNSAKARQRANELEDLEKNGQREFEDESAKLAMNAEIDALDPSDPEYELKKRRITSRYELAKSQREVKRKAEDLTTAADREGVEGQAKLEESVGLDTLAIEKEGRLATIQAQLKAARAGAVSENAFDAQGVGENLMENLRFIATLGKTGHFWDGRTTKGDEERKRQEERAKALEAEEAALKKDIETTKAQAADARSESDQHFQKGAVLGASAARTDLIMENVSASGQRSVDAADKALADKRAKDADAAQAMASLEIEKREVKERIAAAQARKDAAGRAQFEAQGEYDLAVSNGANRATQTSAYQNLQSATINAQNVGAEADATIKALNETLKSIESRFKAAKDYFEKQSGQTKYAWSEQPAGD